MTAFDPKRTLERATNAATLGVQNGVRMRGNDQLDWKRRLEEFEAKVRNLEPVTRESVNELHDEFDRLLDELDDLNARARSG